MLPFGNIEAMGTKEQEAMGSRLVEERKAKGTQADIAKKLRVSRATQIRYESGKRFPTAEYLSRAAMAGLDICYVITGQRHQSNEREQADQRDAKVLLIETLKRFLELCEESLGIRFDSPHEASEPASKCSECALENNSCRVTLLDIRQERFPKQINRFTWLSADELAKFIEYDPKASDTERDLATLVRELSNDLDMADADYDYLQWCFARLLCQLLYRIGYFRFSGSSH